MSNEPPPRPEVIAIYGLLSQMALNAPPMLPEEVIDFFQKKAERRAKDEANRRTLFDSTDPEAA